MALIGLQHQTMNKYRELMAKVNGLPAGGFSDDDQRRYLGNTNTSVAGPITRRGSFASSVHRSELPSSRSVSTVNEISRGPIGYNATHRSVESSRSSAGSHQPRTHYTGRTDNTTKRRLEAIEELISQERDARQQTEKMVEKTGEELASLKNVLKELINGNQRAAALSQRQKTFRTRHDRSIDGKSVIGFPENVE